MLEGLEECFPQSKHSKEMFTLLLVTHRNVGKYNLRHLPSSIIGQNRDQS